MSNSLVTNSSQHPLTTFAVDPVRLPPFIPQKRAPNIDDKEESGARWQDNSVVPPIQYWTTGQGVWHVLGTGTSGLDSLTGDDATPVLPAAGDIQILGAPAGAILFTSGGVGQLNAQVQVDNQTIEINSSNQLQEVGAAFGTATTIGAVTADVITFPMGVVAGTRAFEVSIGVFDAATPSGASYFIISSVRTTGAVSILIPSPDVTFTEEITLVNADATMVVSANNAIVRVTGVAGLTINWRATLRSIFLT